MESGAHAFAQHPRNESVVVDRERTTLQVV